MVENLAGHISLKWSLLLTYFFKVEKLHLLFIIHAGNYKIYVKQDLAHPNWKFSTLTGTEFNTFCPIFEWQKEEPFQKLAAGILASKICDIFCLSDSAPQARNHLLSRATAY